MKVPELSYYFYIGESPYADVEDKTTKKSRMPLKSLPNVPGLKKKKGQGKADNNNKANAEASALPEYAQVDWTQKANKKPPPIPPEKPVYAQVNKVKNPSYKDTGKIAKTLISYVHAC